MNDVQFLLILIALMFQLLICKSFFGGYNKKVLIYYINLFMVGRNIYWVPIRL